VDDAVRQVDRLARQQVGPGLAGDQVDRHDRHLDFVSRHIVQRDIRKSNVELFACTTVEAGKVFLKNSMETPFIPSWRRVYTAGPDIMRQMYDAVAQDLAECPEPGSGRANKILSHLLETLIRLSSMLAIALYVGV
jgi:hypothetical protein